jgi:hypothetical protein
MMLSEGNGEPICGSVVRQMTTDCAQLRLHQFPVPVTGPRESKAYFSLPAQRLLMLLCIADGNVARSLPLHHSLVRPPPAEPSSRPGLLNSVATAASTMARSRETGTADLPLWDCVCGRARDEG